jgi:hypothetical protein
MSDLSPGNKDRNDNQNDNRRIESPPLSAFLSDAKSILVVLVTLTGSLLWLTQQLNGIDKRLTAIEVSVASRWTAIDMHAWALEVARQNPDINIPEVRDIVNLRVYDKRTP